MMDKTTKPQGRTSIPTIGLGTWRFPPELIGEAVEYAITEANYRHVDCASIYGNQVEVGEAFHKVFTKSNVSRDQVFITSKLWNTSHQPKNVQKECEQTPFDLPSW